MILGKNGYVFHEMVHSNGYRSYIPTNLSDVDSFLKWACLAKCGPGIIQAMLKVAPKQPYDGILHYATKQHVTDEIMKILVAKYPDELTKQKEDVTPLQIAIVENQPHLISILATDQAKQMLHSAHYPIRDAQNLQQAYNIVKLYRQFIFPASSLMMLVVPTDDNLQEYGCFQLLGKCRCCRNSMVMVFAMKIKSETNWLDIMSHVEPDNLHVKDLTLQKNHIGQNVPSLDDATFSDCEMTDGSLTHFTKTMTGLKALSLASVRGLTELNVPDKLMELRISHCPHLLESKSFSKIVGGTCLKGLYLEEASREIVSSILKRLQTNRNLEKMGLRMASVDDMQSMLRLVLSQVKEHNTSLIKFKTSLKEGTKPESMVQLEAQLKSWLDFNKLGRKNLRTMEREDFVASLSKDSDGWNSSMIYRALREYPDQWTK